MEEITQTAILGAGITGLCIAHGLQQSGEKFDIIESAKAVGGPMQSTQKDGFLAENGPNSILLKDQRVSDFLETIGLSGPALLEARSEAKKRFIVDDGALCPMPSHPLGIFSCSLFSFRSILRLLREPLVARYKKQGDETLADFITRRLGAEILSNAAAPFVNGIYAGDPSQLSVRHAFPRLWKLEQEHRSLLLGMLAARRKKTTDSSSSTRTISFPSGLSTLPTAVAEKLPQESMQLGCNVTEITPRDQGWHITWTAPDGSTRSADYARLVITVPHHRLSKLPLPSQIIDELKPVSAIESPPVTSLVLGFKREQVEHPLDGFGMLIKETEQSPLLGVLFSSSMFEGRAPDNCVTLTCMMGGTKHPEYAENEDSVVLAELRRLLGVNGEPIFRHRTSWEHAIPQYNLDYQNALDALEACELKHPGLHFAGNYRGGISVTDCIINGLHLGQSLKSKEHL